MIALCKRPAKVMQYGDAAASLRRARHSIERSVLTNRSQEAVMRAFTGPAGGPFRGTNVCLWLDPNAGRAGTAT